MKTPLRQRLLRHLCRDVSLATGSQLRRLLANGSADPDESIGDLTALVAGDYLRRMRVIARLLPALTAPLLRWGPGEPQPDFATVAWQLEKRWDIPPSVVPVYRAGPAARHLFGSGTHGNGINLAAISHDLACTELLLTFATHEPVRVRHWVGEDLRKLALEHGEKLPDVILYDDALAPYLVCEVAGTYPKSRLEAFHAYVAESLRLPYELW